ncbi:MAG: choice-of-anchor Q domain-containing protein [Dokdonella sp.]
MPIRRYLAFTSRPKPLAACLAAALSVASTAPFAAQVPGALPLPAEKAAAVARARANAKLVRPATTTVVANCADSGTGSLRDAMNHAANLDTIDLSHLACSRITLTTGALLADVDNLTLKGPSDHHLTIDGGASAHHYNNAIIHSGAGLLELMDLNITGAKYQDGAGLGGCIWSNNSVYLLRSKVSGCTVSNTTDTGNASGGGIWARGNVNMIHSEVSGNIAVSSNADARGGGVYMQGGSSSFYDTFAGNIAQAGGVSEGGALFVQGSLGMTNSTVSENNAQIGGGLFIDGRHQTFTPRIAASTISTNSATQVGGLFSRVAVYMISDTIAKNTETTITGAGVYVEEDSSIYSSIILLNTGNGGQTPQDDLGGAANTHVTGSHNLMQGFVQIIVPAGFFSLADASDLGPLSDNGGPTLTHSLPPGSAAINQGSPGSAIWDQRGRSFARTADNGTDIGAFEDNSQIIFVNGFN